MPFAVRQVMRPALVQLRRMVLGEEPVANLGHHPFEIPAVRRRTIKVYAGGDTAGCILILFGNIEWKFSASFKTATGGPGRIPHFKTEIPFSF